MSRYAPDADAKYHPAMKKIHRSAHNHVDGTDHHRDSGSEDNHEVTVAEDGGHHPTYGSE